MRYARERAWTEGTLRGSVSGFRDRNFQWEQSKTVHAPAMRYIVYALVRFAVMLDDFGVYVYSIKYASSPIKHCEMIAIHNTFFIVLISVHALR